jgi:3-hydroxymyristoyl/3-hydroxydecanoyl-(acyl carrier protein) dehydratase
MTMWYKWSLENPPTTDELKARIRVPAASPWFDGHFPHHPVLPGIAQLGMVHDLLCRAFKRQLPVRKVSRVRFKQMIGPDQDVVLTVRAIDADGGHSFRISGDEGLICSGLMRLGVEQETDGSRKRE